MSFEGLTETSLLGRSVRKWSLPLFNGAPGPGVSGLKRLLLSQGELAQFYDGEEGMRYLAFVELVPKGVRGNHFHHHKEEWIYVISGSLSLVLEHVKSKERGSLELRAGDLVFIPTGIAHALRTIQPGQAIEFSPSRFDPGDIHAYPLGG